MLFSVESELDEIQLEIKSLQGMVTLFENYRAEYQRYVSRGFLDQENRLSWVESLENTANDLGLNELRYHIEPQQQVLTLVGGVPAGINLAASKLSIESNLVHEGDLIMLLDGLTEVRSGLLVVDGCKIDRVVRNADLTIDANFKANCDTHWYTARYTSDMIFELDDEL
ncbi:MAG: hypothetical protein KUG71_08590 [Porticoccaceae bacterium]|nr:hypothetical protein [Porticoccaceae bacterium]